MPFWVTVSCTEPKSGAILLSPRTQQANSQQLTQSDRDVNTGDQTPAPGPLSRVQLFATLRTVARQALLSMGALQARILEWVPGSFSRGSSGPRGGTCVSCLSFIGRRFVFFLTTEPPGKPRSCQAFPSCLQTPPACLQPRPGQGHPETWHWSVSLTRLHTRRRPPTRTPNRFSATKRERAQEARVSGGDPGGGPSGWARGSG